MTTSTAAAANSRRFLFFAFWLVITIALFYQPLQHWLSYSLTDEDASHLPVVPILAAFFVYLERGTIFRGVLATDLVIPSGLTSCSIAVCMIVTWKGGSWLPLDRLSAYIFALVLLWLAGFLACFGKRAFRNASFSLFFLFLMVPLPQFLLDRVIYFLQKGSAELAAVLFDVSGVPVLREGFVFHLAHVTIEVARECSGIRSSMALIILALLIVHLRLETPWKKFVFIAVGILIMIIKNGIRIVTLTLLASYVDPGFLYGRLHREGGVVFFLLGLALMAPVLWWLERGEPKITPPRPPLQNS
jgi:exosortase